MITSSADAELFRLNGVGGYSAYLPLHAPVDLLELGQALGISPSATRRLASEWYAASEADFVDRVFMRSHDAQLMFDALADNSHYFDAELQEFGFACSHSLPLTTTLAFSVALRRPATSTREGRYFATAAFVTLSHDLISIATFGGGFDVSPDGFLCFLAEDEAEAIAAATPDAVIDGNALIYA